MFIRSAFFYQLLYMLRPGEHQILVLRSFGMSGLGRNAEQSDNATFVAVIDS